MIAEWMKTGKPSVLVPESAHGTNPATAAFAGYKVEAIPGIPVVWPALVEAFAALLDEIVWPDLVAVTVETTSTTITTAPVQSVTL